MKARKRIKRINVFSTNILDVIHEYTFFLFSGTLISAFAVFCCGKHDYEKNIVACLYNLLAAVLQSATIFLLVGWIWSVRWGILFIQLSGINRKNMHFVRLINSICHNRLSLCL
jgi:uncharacterized membrane protein YhaH (DUF805 family)